MAAHLVLQVRRGLARRVPAGADIAEDFLRDRAVVIALGQQAMQPACGPV